MTKKHTKPVKVSTNKPYIKEIPLCFESPWGNTDVALRCSGNSSLLYVNKMTMATFSPFFNAMFFSEFSEKNQDIVDLDIAYDIILDILRIIHHVGRNFKNEGHGLYSPQKLQSLYEESDKYDIPMIRDLVSQQLTETDAYNAYLISTALNLEKQKSEIFEKMSANDVKRLVNENNFVYTTEDMKNIMKKLNISGINPPATQTNQQNQRLSGRPICVSRQTQVIRVIRSWTVPRSFDVSWSTSDAVLRTNDENAPHIHINKSVLASFSPFFHAMFFAEDTKVSNTMFSCTGFQQLQNVVDLDVDYGALLEILRILHHVDRNYGLQNHKLYDAAMLSKMYTVADKLEIDVILELFKQQFSLSKPAEAFEVSILLDLREERTSMLKKMTLLDINEYLKKHRESDEMVFSAVDVNQVLEKLREEVLRIMKCTTCNIHNLYGRAPACGHLGQIYPSQS